MPSTMAKVLDIKLHPFLQDGGKKPVLFSLSQSSSTNPGVLPSNSVSNKTWSSP